MSAPGFSRELLLGFKNKETETKFRLSLHDPKEMRLIIIIGTFFYLLFIVLDFILFKEYFRYFMLIRLGIFLPAMVLIYFSTYTRLYIRHSRVLILAIVVIASGGIILMEYIARESEYIELYFFGLSLILIFFYGTGKITVFLSAMIGFFILVPILIVDSVFVETDIKRIILKTVYMSTMVLAGNVTSGIIQITSRQNFLQKIRIEELSMSDPLTGLKNRLFFSSLIRPEIDDFLGRSEAAGSKSNERITDKEDECCYGLIFLDIDYFKKINDRYGHEAGDLFLQEFSRRVSGIMRSGDVFIRWGGEEFLIVLRTVQKEAARNLSSRIKSVITCTGFLLQDKEIPVTVSGGVVLASKMTMIKNISVENLINMADQALYHSKENGRNCFSEYVISVDEPEGEDSLIMFL